MKGATKYNKKNPNVNIFDWGSWTKEVTNPDGSKSTRLTGAGIGAIASQAAGTGAGFLAGQNESGIGNALGAIGNVASIIPGPYGAMIGGGLKVLGNLTNAAFGSHLNQEFIKNKNDEINSVAMQGSNAANIDDFIGDWASRASVGNFSKKDVGSDGWFAKKAKRKYNQMMEAAATANETQTANYLNTANNINLNNTLAQLNTLRAFGGPLGFDYIPITGAIDYELAQKKLALKDKENSQKYSIGGPLHSNGIDWTNGIITVDTGGSHEDNPYEGVQMGVDPEGVPNLVEEGEVVYNDYVFSNRLKVPEDVRKAYKLRGSKDMTFADAARKVQKPSAERPNDIIEQRSLDDIMGKLMTAQEEVRAKKNKSPEGVMFRHGGHLFGGLTEPTQRMARAEAKREGLLPIIPIMATSLYGNNGYGYDGTISDYYYELPESPEPSKITARPLPSVTNQGNPNPINPTFVKSSKGITDLSAPRVWGNIATEGTDDRGGKRNWLTGLRYVPALGAAIGVTTDLLGLTNKPDYSNADAVLDAVRNVTSSTRGDVTPRHVGEYLTYNPFDRLFYANQLGSQAAATRRGILNSGNGNIGATMAGLLVTDYNAQEQLGKLYRQGEEFNLGQREKVAAFNRATDTFNSEQDLKAQIANREKDLKEASLIAGAAEKAAALRDAVDARASAARSANLTNLFNSLGAIGEDEINRMDARWLAPLIYGAGADRAPSLGGLVKRWPVAANGGRISKRKKGLTYG